MAIFGIGKKKKAKRESTEKRQKVINYLVGGGAALGILVTLYKAFK